MRSFKLAVSESRSERLDAKAAQEKARRQEAAAELRGRCTSAADVLAAWLGREVPEAYVLNVTRRARQILHVLDVQVKAGAAGVQLSYAEWARLLRCCEKTAFTEVKRLRASGHLQAVHDSMPTAETRLGVDSYVTRSIGERRAQARREGRRRRLPPRNIESRAAGSYSRSTVRNLYVLGTAGLAANLGRPRRAVDNSVRRALYVATSLPLSSDSGSGSQRSDSDLGAVDMWTTSGAPRASSASGRQNECSGASLRSGEEKESLRRATSLRSDARLREPIERAAQPPPEGHGHCLAAPAAVALAARVATAPPEEEASMERAGASSTGEEPAGGGARPHGRAGP